MIGRVTVLLASPYLFYGYGSEKGDPDIVGAAGINNITWVQEYKGALIVLLSISYACIPDIMPDFHNTGYATEYPGLISHT